MKVSAGVAFSTLAFQPEFARKAWPVVLAETKSVIVHLLREDWRVRMLTFFSSPFCRLPFPYP